LSDPLKSGGDKKYAPGTVWDSEDDAVRAAARYVDSLNAAHPVLKHSELGGWVYYSEDGFSFNITTSYKNDSINRSDLLSLRVGDSVAVWHTHNFLVDTGIGEKFSSYESGDKGISREFNVPIYLYSPQRKISAFEHQGVKLQNVNIQGRQRLISAPYGTRREVKNVEPKAL
jgi:hypothetical protein